ncbi:hypothetical protein L208DRAFT_1418017 [Tricholoma matsutake]|nr:hypothetical protein L208DRAFT_1418017 [Tricholoma matsutake 945]
MRTNQHLLIASPPPIPEPESEAPRSSSSPQSSMPVRIQNAIPMIPQRRRPARVVTKHRTSYPAPAARSASEHCGPEGAWRE